jgi:hypothetical protein
MRVGHDRPAVYDAVVRGARLLITLGVAAFGRPAKAGPCGDASALRAELEHESERAGQWNLAWRIGFTGTAVGQLALAASGTLGHDDAQAAWVGGVKSSLGALTQWFSPLRIDVPAATGDACAESAALRAAAERAARDERRTFWLSHLGGLAVNIGGALVLAERASWKTGLLSFAIGYPVGLLSTYTMPRASWHRVREPAWTANIVASQAQCALVVGGSF